MKNNKQLNIFNEQDIKNKIYVVRGVQVMIDSDLACIYEVTTGNLNKAVQRNIERFPEDFMFQLSKEEYRSLRFQIGSLNRGTHSKYLPRVFTEIGVATLSGVLKSKRAVMANIQIMRAFVAMRKLLISGGQIYQRLSNIEQMQIEHTVELKEHDNKINELFKILEDTTDIPKQKVYFENQIYDAYDLLSKIIKRAKKSIVIVDNYIDDSVFTVLNKRQNNVSVKIFTKNISKHLMLDLEKHNSQYSKIDIQEFKNSHDRFMLIDDKEVYHFGASLKDLGKKWFGFFKVEKEALQLIEKLL